MDADDVRAAAERIRELSGDVADVLSGGLSFDTFTYRGSLLHDLLDAALVLQKHYLADAGRAADGEAGRKPADWRWEAWTVHTTICKERVGTDGDVRFCALALAGEVGELCNLIKKQWRAEWGYPPEDPDRLRREIADEIADSMVYLFLLAKTLGFDLDHITADKWKRVRPRYGPEVQAALGGGAGRGT